MVYSKYSKMIRILNFWLEPFQKNIVYFILILILSSCVDIIGYSRFESIPKGIFIGMHHYVLCYLMVLVMSLLPQRFRQIYFSLLMALLAFNFLIDVVCVFSFHFTFDREVPAILLGTNENEAMEFVQTFIPICLVVGIILFAGFLILLGKYLFRCGIRMSCYFQFLGLLLVPLSFIVIQVMGAKNWGNVSLNKLYVIMNSTAPPDLSVYRVTPDLITSKSPSPKNIVMIIGESFSKSHSSLYGYDKRTNPQLEELRDSGLLYVFHQVKSPALNTVPAFKSIMSLYRHEDGDKVKWYECMKLEDILDATGYTSYWISNQSQKGFHDNIVATYAMLSDTAFFVGNRFMAMGKDDKDGILVEEVRKFLPRKQDNEKRFFVIHLMGSHPDFKKRYPLAFDKFDERDYMERPESQRDNLAAYDNSILYNDRVVYGLMNLFKDRESLVFYFSDHALDVYESRDDYVGHAISNDPQSREVGSDIPFMVYTSPEFQQNFPIQLKCFRNNTMLPFCTENMIYTIMDVIGVRFVKNNDVEKYSLLN